MIYGIDADENNNEPNPTLRQIIALFTFYISLFVVAGWVVMRMI